jgi:hypothetical protein
MASKDDSLIDLKSELNALKDELDDSIDPVSGKDYSSDMMDLKKRIDKSDQEMRAMTEAMKTTLFDVRTLMQDMDNPFNMLRDMGVDKLVNKAVETVEDEVNKQKIEEAKKRMAESERKPEKIVEIEKSPSLSSISGLQSPFGNQGPTMNLAPNPFVTTSATSTLQESAQQRIPATPIPAPGQPMITRAGGQRQSTSNVALSEMEIRLSKIEDAIPQILEKLEKTEEIFDSLYSKFSVLLERLEKADGSTASNQLRDEYSRYNPVAQKQFNNRQQGEGAGGVYYEAYVSLVADYLVLRFGEKGTEEILLEGMYKGWASPKVVRDILDHSNNQSRGKDSRLLPFGVGMMSSDVEDKILLTSLLRNLDRPVTMWEEPTHLFMLLALVTRTRETKLTRA